MCKLLFFSLLFSFSYSLLAEYRVYEYMVREHSFDQLEGSKGYIDRSTQNPVSYVAYHGGASSIKVDLLRTWLCVGHTGSKKELCAAPLENQLVQQALKEKPVEMK